MSFIFFLTILEKNEKFVFQSSHKVCKKLKRSMIKWEDGSDEVEKGTVTKWIYYQINTSYKFDNEHKAKVGDSVRHRTLTLVV